MSLARLMSVVAVVSAAFVAPGIATASSIKISDGISTLIINDQDFVPGPGNPIDMDSTAGIVYYKGSVGSNWTFTVTTGFTKPDFGSATDPEMHLGVQASSKGAGTLTVWFSETSFGPSGTLLDASISSNGGATTYKTYQGVGLFDTATSLTTSSLLAGAYSVTDITSLSSAVGPYSLTQKVTLTHTVKGVSSFDATLSVPDGGTTLSLLGLGLLGIVGMGRLTRPSRVE